MSVDTEPHRCEHDFEWMGSGYYDGQRPGFSFEQFYCRRCLLVVAADERGHRTKNPDPKWFHLERRNR